jgi:acetylornithine deacetylase/succinyl-diaminopimelate desuccinylase-like protein
LPESKLSKVLARIDANLDASIAGLCQFLKIPSIATDPRHAVDCLTAANWLRNYFEALGMTAEIKPTTGQPVVLATLEPAKPASHLAHVLFYGHYDVQPSDPDGLWTTPPFGPEIRKAPNGRDALFARGACDDKGQLMTFVEASKAWLAVNGDLPFRLTILIEGDEEGDNIHLDRFVAANKKSLRADIAWICDTGLWDEKVPCLTTSLRGCIGEEIIIEGPKVDLHSGDFGGPAVNPIKVLSRIIASLHDAKGRITIPGFYDGIKPLSKANRVQLAGVPFDAKTFMKNAGLKHAAGEPGFSILEQVWMRPTAEVNGMIGGYTGVGAKTVIPAKASAKLTFRLIEGQKPDAIRKSFRRQVRNQLPPDCSVRFLGSGGNLSGVSVDGHSRWIRLASGALEAEWGARPVLAGSGGSIPVVASFRDHLGIDSLMMGFGLDDDCVHSPDEKYDIRSFHKGTRSWARLIASLEHVPPE